MRQRNPEVYTEIVKAYPDRVRPIYIRKIDNDPESDAAQCLDLLVNEDGLKPVNARLTRRFGTAQHRKTVRRGADC